MPCTAARLLAVPAPTQVLPAGHLVQRGARAGGRRVRAVGHQRQQRQRRQHPQRARERERKHVREVGLGDAVRRGERGAQALRHRLRRVEHRVQRGVQRGLHALRAHLGGQRQHGRHHHLGHHHDHGVVAQRKQLVADAQPQVGARHEQQLRGVERGARDRAHGQRPAHGLAHQRQVVHHHARQPRQRPHQVHELHEARAEP
mmetsp:Transcript_29343/g.74770  ORF Transcript_29343/g.74770 Transcript_29343/m.74770 type:complete len:202 (-) Transcript_29343:1113-1718(-)